MPGSTSDNHARSSARNAASDSVSLRSISIRRLPKGDAASGTGEGVGELGHQLPHLGGGPAEVLALAAAGIPDVPPRRVELPRCPVVAPAVPAQPPQRDGLG